MRYNLLITILLLSASYLLAAPKKGGAPDAVRIFINNLEQLTKLSDSQQDEAYRIMESNQKLFSFNFNINESDTEIFYLGIEPVHTVELYCTQLYSLLYKERVLKLSHEILHTEPIFSAGDGKDELCFYDTKVKKICTYNNDEKIVWQSLEVNKDGLIDRMASFKSRPHDWNINETKQKMSSNEDNEQSSSSSSTLQKDQDILPIQETTPQSEQDFIRLAARYYTSKNYSSAANTLKILTEKYPNNAEAWFRLACIVKYKTRWSKKVYKDPHKSAIEFMKKASTLANGKLKSKADNALFYWEHPNYM